MQPTSNPRQTKSITSANSPEDLIHSFLLSALLFVAASTVCALEPTRDFHHYHHTHWGISNGLPQINVTSLAQDDEGYLWIGTQGGLSRFDGARHRVFTPENEPALSSIEIDELFFDNQQRLWIADARGLALYRDGIFSPLPFDVRQYGRISDIEEMNGAVFVAASGIFIAESEQLRPILSNLQVLDMQPYEGELWFITPTALYSLQLPSNSLTKRVAFSAAPPQAAHLVVWDDRLVLARNDQLVFWNGATAQLQPLPPIGINKEPITSLFVDSDNNLWGSSQNFTFRAHRLRESVEEIESLYGAEGSLNYELVSENQAGFHPWTVAWLEDREKSVWRGSRIEGLSQIRDGWAKRYSSQDGLHDPFVWSIEPGQHGLWIGTNTGLSLLTEAGYELVRSANELPDGRIYTLMEDHDGSVWLGTQSGLVHLVDNQPVDQKVLQPISGHHVLDILRTSDNVLWVATATGLFKQTANGRLSKLTVPNDVLTNEFRYLYEDGDQNLWLGTRRGLFQLNGEVFLATGNPTLSDTFVTSIVQLPSGQLLVGTFQDGLFLQDSQRAEKWLHLSEANSLPYESSFSLQIANERVWVSSHSGVYFIPLNALMEWSKRPSSPIEAKVLLSMNDTFPGSERVRCCNGAGGAKSAIYKQQLWYPSLNGVVNLEPAAIQFNPVLPNAIIESVSSANTAYKLPASQVSPRLLTLPPEQRNFSLAFTGLSLEQPESVRFRYRLLGLNPHWRETRQRTIDYQNLPPGTYRFQLLASNNHGQWTDEPVELVIRIPPFFYETQWFALLTTAAAVLTAVVLLSLWRRRYLKTQLKLEMVVADRTRELHQLNDLLIKANLELQNVSQTDKLTGLKNRHFLEDQLERDLAYFSRHHADDNKVMAFILLDLDHFKRINDNYGHSIGDEVLQFVANILVRQVREEDYAVRLGGEEFLLVFREIDPEQIQQVVERLRSEFSSSPFTKDDLSIPVTASIGFVTYPLCKRDKHLLSWDKLLQLADFALYRVKENGRDGWASIECTAESFPLTSEGHFHQQIERGLARGKLRLRSSYATENCSTSCS